LIIVCGVKAEKMDICCLTHFGPLGMILLVSAAHFTLMNVGVILSEKHIFPEK